jgi:hypothetical protein
MIAEIRLYITGKQRNAIFPQRKNSILYPRFL